MTDTKWKIWSQEHHAWWRPNACGYTHYRQDAGVYSFVEACAILRKANQGEEEAPNEAMILVLENE